ncbi:uncharacterized protein LOC105279478 [Ooceraea biroi]|uniref:uncharacterized protein LOC105279478 n=1 Tax=Ooceraea biroi TaxID=2015173 RepID=UPI00097164A5|nr:uncharacterized protein LOC105279478 [Ooceraea biroi]
MERHSRAKETTCLLSLSQVDGFRRDARIRELDAITRSSSRKFGLSHGTPRTRARRCKSEWEEKRGTIMRQKFRIIRGMTPTCQRAKRQEFSLMFLSTIVVRYFREEGEKDVTEGGDGKKREKRLLEGIIAASARAISALIVQPILPE